MAPLQFGSLSELIEHLSGNEQVVGIFEYGSRTHSDMSPGGDYDLTLVTERCISSNFNGVHFHVQGVPVDCMLLTPDDLLTEQPRSILLLAHVDARIVHDPSGQLHQLQQHMQNHWAKSNPVTDSLINFYRFFYKHTLDKLKYRLHDDEVFSRYSIQLAATNMLDTYQALNQLEPGQPRQVLAHMAHSAPELYVLYSELLSEIWLDRQYQLLADASELLLKKYLGVWKDGEVLFHLTAGGVNNPQEQQQVCEQLLRADQLQSDAA